jgi:type IV secretory pathway TraG/TraD family ATPase VirD4
MQAVKDSGIVDISVEDFPVLAVNVLSRLGYDNIPRASKALNQIIAVQRLDEQVGRDMWRHEYRVVVRWRQASEGVLVEAAMEETKGGASEAECVARCERLFDELEDDAVRFAEVASSRKPNVTYGSARWGTNAELEAEGYVTKVADPKRFILGRTEDNSYLQVPELNTYAHALVCGRTGVGKSTGFFIPQLVERIGTSMIVTEATPGPEDGELYKLTSGWRKNAGHHIYCFNPSDMTSHRVNPLDRVRLAPDELKMKRAAALADLIIMNGQSGEMRGDTKMWCDAERHLLVSIFLYAAAGDPKYANLGAVRWLILKGPSELERLMRRCDSEIAQMEFEGWMRLSGETNFKYGVFSGLNTRFTPFQTDQMVALMEETDIDLDALKSQLFTLYIAVNSRSSDSQLIGALLLNFVIDHLSEVRAEMKYPITMLLDEFTNFGKIQGVSKFLSIVRKNKIGLVLGFQNYAQLEEVYSRKESQTIVDQPQTQVYFKQKGYKEAKELSDAIGRTTVEESTLDDSGRVREIVQGRSLATPDELISLKNEVVVFLPTVNVLKLPITKPDAYKDALTYPAPERERHEVSEFIKKRGAKPKQREEPEAPATEVEPKSKPKPEERRGRPGRFDRTAPNRSSDEESETEEKPQYKKPPLEDWE